MRIAIVGTSHVAMIKAAFEAGGLGNWGDCEPFYLSVTAPMLSKQNVSGWPGSAGTMHFDTSIARNYLARLLGDPDITFDPAKFDVILLVDFFFVYDFAYILRNRKREDLCIGDIPVSDTCFGQIIAGAVGVSRYSANSAVGEVAENSMLPLLKAIRARNPAATIVLVPRPMHPSGNRDTLGIRLSGDQMSRAARLFEQAAQSQLSPLGISLVPRTGDQTDAATGMTPDRFSVGPHANKPGSLDEHVTLDYGTLTLAAIREQIIHRFPTLGPNL